MTFFLPIILLFLSLSLTRFFKVNSNFLSKFFKKVVPPQVTILAYNLLLKLMGEFWITRSIHSSRDDLYFLSIISGEKTLSGPKNTSYPIFIENGVFDILPMPSNFLNLQLCYFSIFDHFFIKF
jgi:hypothetical protein